MLPPPLGVDARARAHGRRRSRRRGRGGACRSSASRRPASRQGPHGTAVTCAVPAPLRRRPGGYMRCGSGVAFDLGEPTPEESTPEGSLSGRESAPRTGYDGRRSLMRRDEPPSPRLSSLLRAALVGFSLLVGGGMGAIAVPVSSAEVIPQESVGGDATAGRPSALALRRLRAGRSWRPRRGVIRTVRPGWSGFAQSSLAALTTPLRGPPALVSP